MPLLEQFITPTLQGVRQGAVKSPFLFLLQVIQKRRFIVFYFQQVYYYWDEEWYELYRKGNDMLERYWTEATFLIGFSFLFGVLGNLMIIIILYRTRSVRTVCFDCHMFFFLEKQDYRVANNTRPLIPFSFLS